MLTCSIVKPVTTRLFPQKRTANETNRFLDHQGIL